jgi:hypothetical protein
MITAKQIFVLVHWRRICFSIIWPEAKYLRYNGLKLDGPGVHQTIYHNLFNVLTSMELRIKTEYQQNCEIFEDT